VDLTGNLWFRHDLYFLFVAVFSNITLITMYFKFSRHVTGPFADLLPSLCLRVHLSSSVPPASVSWALPLVPVVSSRVAMSTGQETVTPQKSQGGGSVAPSPAALSPVLEGGFLTTIKALSREATRVWAILVSDHCKGDKEVLINVVLWSVRNSGTSRVL